MAGFQLTFVIEGRVELSRRLEGLEASMVDMTDAYRRAAKLMQGFFEGEVFQTQGAALGARWKPLKASTLAFKMRHGYPTTPLVATGAMQRGFRSIVSSDQAVVYNTAPYFKYHQSNQPRVKLPRRVMMAFTNNTKAEVVRIFQQHIQASMQRP